MLLKSDSMPKITIKCNDSNKMLTLKSLFRNTPSSFETKILKMDKTCHPKSWPKNQVSKPNKEEN